MDYLCIYKCGHAGTACERVYLSAFEKRLQYFFTVFFITVLFTAMHLGAFEAGVIPVLNVITMCLFTTMLYETERTLIASIMAHAVWNIVGAIFLGCVNLAEDYPHMFTLISS